MKQKLAGAVVVVAVAVGVSLVVMQIRRSDPRSAVPTKAGAARLPLMLDAPVESSEQPKPVARRKAGGLVPISQATRPAPASAKTPPAIRPTPRPALRVPRRALSPASQFARAVALIQHGKKFHARAVLTPLLLRCEDPKARVQIKQMLDGLNKDLFFSRRLTPDSEYYTVQPGDSYWLIAKTTGNGIDLIKMVNQRSSNNIRPGERLKIIKGEFSVLVEKRQFRLMVFLNGHYIKEYPVGLGRNDKTPVGGFVIASGKMVKKPPWTAPNGKVYAAGDPRNILGTRWIGFRETAEYSGYGIHGTTDPASIGKAASNGCVRMHNRDVEELFAILKPGDKVAITR